MHSIFLQYSGGGLFGDPLTMMLLSAGLFVVYFLILRPGQKKAKEAKAFVDALQPGSKVITSGGIHGKVVKVDDNVVTLQIASNTQIKIEKSSISGDLSATIKED